MSPATEPPRPTDRTRDHLSNERTFLSWIRTALALIGLGFVLARMGLFLRQIAQVAPEALRVDQGQPGQEFVVSGIVFLALGTLLAAWSGNRYRRARLAIDAQSFEPESHAVWALSSLVVLGGLVIGGLVLWRVGLPEPVAPRSVAQPRGGHDPDQPRVDRPDPGPNAPRPDQRPVR